ncbi:hypothetical protein CPC08DRAFT_770426 [Agrocybe pediades]|nr:hypothetical protein CPC08DRAFT_770426 [Agrocybe pediades]
MLTEHDDTAIAGTLWGSILRLPIKVPRDHHTGGNSISPNADLRDVIRFQARTDKALRTLIPRQADLIKFLEEVQEERHEHMELLAKQELDLQAWQQNADADSAAMVERVKAIERRLAAIEKRPKAVEEGRMAKLEELVNACLTSLDPALARVAELEQKLQAATARVEELEAAMSAHAQREDDMQELETPAENVEQSANPASPPPHPDSAAPSAAPTPFVQEEDSEDEHGNEGGVEAPGEDSIDVDMDGPQPMPHADEEMEEVEQEVEPGNDRPPAPASAEPTPSPLEVAVMPPTPAKDLDAAADNGNQTLGEGDTGALQIQHVAGGQSSNLAVPRPSRSRATSSAGRSRSTSVMSRTRSGSATRRSGRLNPPQNKNDEDEGQEGEGA